MNEADPTRFVYGTPGSGEGVVVEARERTGTKVGDDVSFGIRPVRAMLFPTSRERLRSVR